MYLALAVVGLLLGLNELRPMFRRIAARRRQKRYARELRDWVKFS